jgi:hypothetical protein
MNFCVFTPDCVTGPIRPFRPAPPKPVSTLSRPPPPRIHANRTLPYAWAIPLRSHSVCLNAALIRIATISALQRLRHHPHHHHHPPLQRLRLPVRPPPLLLLLPLIFHRIRCRRRKPARRRRSDSCPVCCCESRIRCDARAKRW